MGCCKKQDYTDAKSTQQISRNPDFYMNYLTVCFIDLLHIPPIPTMSEKEQWQEKRKKG